MPSRAWVCAVVAASALGTIACKGAQMPDLKRPDIEINIVAVKTELIQIARAEQRYQVMYSKYATFEELQKDELLAGPPDRNGYTFSAEIDGAATFKVTAAPADPKHSDWPTLYVDEKMQVVESGKE